MTIINPKSIAGVTSITTASGADNLLTVHTNNTTERVRINNDGDVIVGSGITVSPDGDIFATGVTTATKFVGDGSELTGVASTENIRTNTNATFLQNINVSGSTTTGSLVSSGAISGTTGTFTGDVDIADKIVHTGDTNTAIRFSGADTIKLETAGTERFQVDSSGNIYVGGVGGSATAGTLWFNDTSANASKIAQSNGNSALTFHTGSSQPERLRINSDGDVGIGLDNPDDFYSKELVIKAASEGGITIRNTNSGDWNYIMFASGDSGNARYDSYIGVDHGNNKVRISTNETSSAKNVELRSDGNFHISDGDLVVASGHGISFSATDDGSGSSQAELLDDYEEGEWTPTINVGTFSVFVTCKYVKIGKFVKVNGGLIFNNTTDSATVQISGLPFAGDGSQFVGNVWLRRTNTSDKKYIAMIGQSGNSIISYHHDSNGNDMGGAIAYSNFDNSSTYNNFSISYFTNS